MHLIDAMYQAMYDAERVYDEQSNEKSGEAFSAMEHQLQQLDPYGFYSPSVVDEREWCLLTSEDGAKWQFVRFFDTEQDAKDAARTTRNQALVMMSTR